MLRDIRPDLRDRLAQLPAKKESLEAELAALNAQQTQLEALLVAEERMWGNNTQLSFPLPRAIQHLPSEEQTLADALRGVLADGKTHPLADFKERLKDSPLLKDSTSPGRTIHFALLALSNHGTVKRTEKGEWRLADVGAFNVIRDSAAA